jgi:putative PEP-CTERM system histidine kinase
VLGLITIGDRVGGIGFSLQDFDMFRCIAEQAAASLLNIHLSQKLLQAKELESFQKMAAFFVHDLKNAASTLNLMLKNLPVHFDDPAFREDALRGIAKTVARINDLTGRLNTFRDEMKIKLAEADLNELIAHAATTVQLGSGVEMVQALTPLPRFNLDREQIGKVMVNLLLNASEAMDGRGQLTIASGKTDGWAVVTVADTGCGMSPDFVSHSLFHPFQTTKKNGLGIGMFHCKSIVEAHGGKITVASELGSGTLFRVFLPLSS